MPANSHGERQGFDTHFRRRRVPRSERKPIPVQIAELQPKAAPVAAPLVRLDDHLNECIRLHRPRIERLFSSLGIDAHDAADLLQAVWLRLRDAELCDQEPKTLEGWLVTVARHLALDFHRAKGRETARLRLVAKPDRVAEADNPALQAELRDLLQAVLVAIDRLPGDQRLVIVAFFLEGRSVVEVAEQWGIPLATTYHMRARALASLRRFLDCG
jgi:RNA polymerase sigma-70 factor (ECF subfamily)